MKKIGIKLADGSFYPIMEDGKASDKNLVLTTVKDNQTRVIVDMYRSKTDSMTDAEYIDSLQIDNLVEHPHGSAELSLNIALDENNELSATINDPETGASNSATVTLVSRTLEERLEPTNYELVNKDADNIPQQKNDNTVAKVAGAAVAGAVGGGLLAHILKNQEQENKKAENTEIANEADNTMQEITETPEMVTDAVLDENEITEPTAEEIVEMPDKVVDDEVAEPTAEESVGEIAEPEISAETVVDDGIPEINEEIVEPPADEIVEMPDEIVDDEVTEPQVNDETVEEMSETMPTDDDFALPEFDEDATDTETENADDLQSLDEPVENSITDDASVITEVQNDTESEIQDDLPESEGDNELTEDDTTLSNDDFSLPDFDDEPTENDNTAIFSDDLPDNVNDDVSSSEENADDITPSNGIDFDGLYDEETAQGNSNAEETETDDSVKKKTRAPVIICITCAIICILATLLVLFVVPSKYNLLSKHTKSEENEASENIDTVEEPSNNDETEITEGDVIAPETEENEVEPIESKEEEIVVVTEPEKIEAVIPTTPEEPKEKPSNIQYKIKWGDTLWDIADAYYKNPWRYHKIARHNHIKNPDYIISGTTIELPAE